MFYKISLSDTSGEFHVLNYNALEMVRLLAGVQDNYIENSKRHFHSTKCTMRVLYRTHMEISVPGMSREFPQIKHG